MESQIYNKICCATLIKDVSNRRILSTGSVFDSDGVDGFDSVLVIENQFNGEGVKLAGYAGAILTHMGLLVDREQNVIIMADVASLVYLKLHLAKLSAA